MSLAAKRGAAILQEIGEGPRIGAEVGVHKGLLSAWLLANRDDLCLLLVDPWEDQIPFFEAVQRVAPWLPERCRIWKMRSLEAAGDNELPELDFAFIDADHSYEAVRDDLAAWWPKIKSGGILCGHDFRDEPEFLGVRLAVGEFCLEHGLELRRGDNFTWFLTKP